MERFPAEPGELPANQVKIPPLHDITATTVPEDLQRAWAPDQYAWLSTEAGMSRLSSAATEHSDSSNEQVAPLIRHPRASVGAFFLLATGLTADIEAGGLTSARTAATVLLSGLFYAIVRKIE